METNKPKQLPYQDGFEDWRNMSRIMITVMYNPLLAFFMFRMMVQDPEDFKGFLYTIDEWPFNHYFFFFAPLFVCAMNLQMLVIEKRSRVSIPRVSRHFIYASLVVSAIFYGVFVVALLS